MVGNWISGMSDGVKCHDLVRKHLGFPMLEMTEIQIGIWKCMWLKAGNMKLVKMN